MAKRASDADDFDEATSRSTRKPPTEDALRRVREYVAQARDLQLEIDDRNSALSELKKRHYELLNTTLPTMFEELGITTLGLEADGNHPAFEARRAKFYRANIAADWDDERRQRAFDWLRDNELGDLIKAEYSVEFGMDTEKQQQKLVAALEKLKIPYAVDEAVPWNTLTAVVKNMIEKEGVSPPLDVIGATVGTVVSVKEVKPTTQRSHK